MSTAGERNAERRSRFEEGFRVLQGTREFVTYPEDASFRMWYSDVPWRYDAHIHSAIEVIMTLEGHVDYLVKDQEFHVGKGEILIIPPEMSHGLSMGENSSRLLFLFEPEPLLELRDMKQMKSSFDRVFYLHDGSETQERIWKALEKASEIYQERDLMWNTQCYGLLMQIYAMLGQKYLSGMYPRRELEKAAMDQEVISSAMNYIDTHFREDVSLDDVASFAGFSRFYFSRSFKQQTGFSFKDYLSQRRIQVAMELLIQTQMPIREVAERSGFGSVATFNRSFREYKNCTPTQYRAIYGRD